MALRYKKLLTWWPELVLMVFIAQYWISMQELLNPISLVLTTAFALLFVFKKRALGLGISIVLTCLFCYLYLALFSDIVNIEVFDASAIRFLIFGCLYMGIALTASLKMLFKYFYMESKTGPVQV